MTVSKKVILRRTLLVIQLVLLVPIVWFLWHLLMPRGYTSTKAEVLPLQLSSGHFETRYYAAKHAKGIIIVATGDGG